MKTIEFDTEPRMPIFNIYSEVLTVTSVAPPCVLPCPRELFSVLCVVCLVLRLKRADLV